MKLVGKAYGEADIFGLLIFSIALLAGCRLNDPETWKNCTWNRSGAGIAERNE